MMHLLIRAIEKRWKPWIGKPRLVKLTLLLLNWSQDESTCIHSF
jgi:hypothetical protein